jgi:excisionase family DNA binding protein
MGAQFPCQRAFPLFTGAYFLICHKEAALPTHESKTISIDEAARLLGIARNSAYDAAARGEIPTIRIGKRILVPRVAFERMLAGETQPKAAAS